MNDVTNGELARVLREIGEYLDMQDVAFKPRVYERAAEAIEGLGEEAADVYSRGGRKLLEEIPGVGKSIAATIEELLKTGRSREHAALQKKTPVNLAELSRVEGLGPKKIKTLYQHLGIRRLADLEEAAAKGKVARLSGFGAKSEENIKKGIEFLKRDGGRFVLGFVMPEVRAIEERLRSLPHVRRCVVAGSVRRRKETIGDADILVVSSKPEPIMDAFVALPGVLAVHAHGGTKSAVKMKSGLNVDLRVVPEASYGAALNYFTGSKDHNVALRKIAIRRGMKLNEYGLFSASSGKHADKRGQGRGRTRKEVLIAGKTEEGIYAALGLRYILPELREMTGEIEASRKNTLPNLVDYGDLKGDLQTQTDWTDGSASIEEMARAAAKAGLEYIAITDHTKRLAMTNGLDERRILKQMAEIERINQKLKVMGYKLKVLSGTECDILKDGSLDLPDTALARLDVVGVSVHSYFNLPKKEQTERIMRAMENRHVDILFHPTGRIIGRRPPYEVDISALIKKAKETGTVLEIDAYPDRLDLKDEYIRMAVEAGVKLAIDSDAHQPAHFSVLEYGIAQARRGWATKKDIINTRPAEELLDLLKK